jgi:hypothetical protein
MKKFFSIAMVALGSTLEIYYYVMRFLQDGTTVLISSIIAAALNLLLSMAVYKSEKSKKWYTLIIVLGAYSVLATSAGQTFSLLNREAAGTMQVEISKNEELISEYKSDIAALDRERNTLSAQLEGIQTIEQRYEFKETVKKAEQRLDEIKKDKIRLQSLIDSTTQKSNAAAKEGVRATSIYDFYGSMKKWTGTDWIKFIFHTVLSGFIAIMAPVGVLTWPKKTEIKKEVVEVVAKKKKVSMDQIKQFVGMSWYRVRQKTSEFMLPRETFFDFMKRQGYEYPEDIYDEIESAAKRIGVIGPRGEILEKNEPAAYSKLAEDFR